MMLTKMPTTSSCKSDNALTTHDGERVVIFPACPCRALYMASMRLLPSATHFRNMNVPRDYSLGLQAFQGLQLFVFTGIEA